MMRRGWIKTAGGAGLSLAVVALLLVATIGAGLQLAGTEYLRGYPAAARLDADRPPAGFAPLAGRFIAKVLGLDNSDDDEAARAASRGGGIGRSDVGPPAPPRVVVSHPFTNDGFARAFVVPDVPFTGRSDTRSATREQGEPSNCAAAGGTAWYRFTPNRDRALLATTFGSDYAAAVGVFAGERLDALTALGCGSSTTGNAQTGFRARKGQTYYFQVTGLAGGGNLVFNLDPLGRTERVSVSSSGEQGNSYSYLPSVSADGRFVGFNSLASNLTPDSPECSLPGRVIASSQGTMCHQQAFVHDLATHTTTLVSVSSSGEPGNGTSGAVSLSGDGRYVAFHSSATNLGVGGDPVTEADPDGFNAPQVYVRDRLSGVTELVSKSVSGGPGTGASSFPSISADGRYVAFQSSARDVTREPAPHCGGMQDPPCFKQVFVRDRLTGTTVRASRGPSGEWANWDSDRAAMSADGRTVAFRTGARNLGPRDTNGWLDVYLTDLRTGVSELVSVSDSDLQGNGPSGGHPNENGTGYVSGDGRYVAFQSEATNLVADDTNGASDFFVRDRLLGTTVRVSVSSSGVQGTPPPTGRESTSGDVAIRGESTSGGVAISADGRYAAFDTALRFDDNDPAPLQIFVRDLVRGVTIRVSVSSLGDSGDGHSMKPAFSGGVVAFSSSAGNLVDNDTNTGCIAPRNTRDNCSDIFVHELSEYTRTE